ncbi:hypothetical protein G9A89_011956 [Geosiphon pyriformis]|nr:hypothetical protein G9A89_011956 [Geosiphon pyriformis]
MSNLCILLKKNNRLSNQLLNLFGARISSLSENDAILEPNVTDLVDLFLENSGEPSDLLDCLANSYEGTTEEIKLLLAIFGEFSIEKAQEAIQDSVQEVLLNSFHNVNVENCMESNPERLRPTVELIESPYWRNVLYKLSEKFPANTFLNTLIKAISDKGLTQEIQHLPATSAYAGVHLKVILDLLNKIIMADDFEVEKLLPDLVETVSLQPHSYLLTQALLKSLSKEKGGYPLRKISKELEKAVSAIHKDFIVSLRNLLNNAPVAVSGAIARLPPTPGDVVWLHKTYSTTTPPPSPIFLRDPELLNYLMTTIFVPNPKSAQLKDDLRSKYLHLIAFAASAKDTEADTVDISKVEETSKILKRLEAAIGKKSSTGSELNSVITEVLDYIHLPVASMALIFWCRYLLLETPFYEKHFKPKEPTRPHLLLEEIASRHPLQRPHIFALFADNLLIQSRSLSPEILTAIRKQLFDRMVVLVVEFGYVIPVLQYMESNAKRLIEENQLFYFVRKILEQAEAPYSSQFFEHMLNLIEQVEVNLESGLETKPITKQFLENAPEFSEGSSAQKTLERLQVMDHHLPADRDGTRASFNLFRFDVFDITLSRFLFDAFQGNTKGDQ